MKKIVYISVLILFIFALFGKAQAKDGESGRDEFRLRTSNSGSFGENQWSRGGDDDGEDNEDESDDDSRIRVRMGAQATITNDDDSDDDNDDSDDNEINDDKEGLRKDGENRFKLFPFLKGPKKEGVLDMIQRQEMATGSGTHSPFFKENKGNSDNRNPRSDFRNKIGMRFTFAMHNLDNLRDRLASHIDKLKTKGVDTTNASALLVLADTDIASAKIAVDALQAKIDSLFIVTPPTTPVTATVTDTVTDTTTVQNPLDDATKAEIRTLATSAKDAIVKAYKSLGAVIGEIKKIRQENDISDDASDDSDDDDDDDSDDADDTSSTATTTN